MRSIECGLSKTSPKSKNPESLEEALKWSIKRAYRISRSSPKINNFQILNQNVHLWVGQVSSWSLTFQLETFQSEWLRVALKFPSHIQKRDSTAGMRLFSEWYQTARRQTRRRTELPIRTSELVWPVVHLISLVIDLLRFRTTKLARQRSGRYISILHLDHCPLVRRESLIAVLDQN